MLSPHLVLASASAARRGLLEAAGLEFATSPVQIDEGLIKKRIRSGGGSAEAAATELAFAKAAATSHPGAVVLGCDQILVSNGAWFDKPGDMAAARQQLATLRGHEHSLVTATVATREGIEVWRHLAAPRLKMRPFSDTFLERYLTLEGGAILHCVGAYRLEGPGMQLFEWVEGSDSAILGLPMLPLLSFLRDYGVLTT